MVGKTDTSGNNSESDSIDSSRLDESHSPPFTPDVPTHLIRRSQRSHRQIDFGPYVTS